MKSHFELTLRISSEDLMILTTYLEHAYDRALQTQQAMPRPLARRLREIAGAFPPDSAFQYQVLVATPHWGIRSVSDDGVTIATMAEGASLSQLLDLLGHLVPSCLTAEIVYAPLNPQVSQIRALH